MHFHSLFSPRCRLSSSRRHHAVTLCHASFLWSQAEFSVSTSSSGDALSHLPSQAETEILNPNTTAGHPPRIARLSPSTTIKMSYQSLSLSPSLNNVSILSPP
jgi:hypothetical protein